MSGRDGFCTVAGMSAVMFTVQWEICRTVMVIVQWEIENIRAAIEHLTDALPDELQPLLDWFDNYGGRRLRRGNGRRPSLFPVGMWNLYERTLNNEDKTDNNAEAAHRR
ncbi:hypothetical protein chiPu_0013060 [Chiloscyllium punctatum]|uniref:Uncharacterized protein n=1 Tax=Chiloscyllium punctatum TaxID=137246 RepID=A0A401SW11_CHIPU|nr:hypothetical protein [Chiloscyllium punctatum]